MATFVKLTTGDIVNAQHIKSIKCHEYVEPSAFREALRNGRDSESGEYRLGKVPSIELQLGTNPNPLLLKYESEQERDAEFERIKAILFQSQAIVTFGNLMFDTKLIQSLLVEFYGFDDANVVLQLWVKMPGTRRFIFLVNQANQVEWELCMSLLAQFNMQVPTEREYDL